MILLALTKLGHATLFFSTRISQEATDNLMKITRADYFIVEERYLDVAEEITRAQLVLAVLLIMVCALQQRLSQTNNLLLLFHLLSNLNTSLLAIKKSAGLVISESRVSRHAAARIRASSALPVVRHASLMPSTPAADY